MGARDKAHMDKVRLERAQEGVEDPLPEEQVGRTRSGAGFWLLPQGRAAPAGRGGGAEVCLFTFVPQCCNQCRAVSVNR